jgi:hypothetical protein
MKKPKNPPGTHRELWEQDSPFRYPRVEQVRHEQRKERKYRRRPQDYLEDEDEADDNWSD